MLIEFMQKNPDSKLVPYAESSYMRLLARCIEEKNYQELEPLAEKWNSFKPGNQNTIAMIATAARELKHNEKYLRAMEEMHKHTPQLDFAKEIAALHKEMQNDDKYSEWVETVVLKDPGEAADFRWHYELFHHYSKKSDSAKMMEYAQSALKAIDQLQNPSAEVAKILPDIRHELNHSIGVMYFTDKKFDDAMTYFLKAIRDKKYSNGYYWIGNCLWEQGLILNARMAFAKAQLLGESAQASADDKSIAPKAKERMEQLYKAMQNNTLVGIDRRYKRAQEMSDEDLIKPLE
jgi:tetratricopeptide (TPR) repeat protein